jgi:hypothetical protein
MGADFDDKFLCRFGRSLPVGRLHGPVLEAVPLEAGVYVVTLPSTAFAGFRETSTGGRPKGKDPTLEVTELKARWVEGTRVLYVGKAECLRLRIWELIGFAYGAPTHHWGGRLLWQLLGRETLEVGWQLTTGGEPEAVEAELLEEFMSQHEGRKPFANLRC